MLKLTRCLTALIVGILAFGAVSEAAAAPARDVLVIGSISRSIKEEIETFRPLADYLKLHLSAVGIRDVDIVVATTPGEMSRQLANLPSPSPLQSP